MTDTETRIEHWKCPHGCKVFVVEYEPAANRYCRYPSGYRAVGERDYMECIPDTIGIEEAL